MLLLPNLLMGMNPEGLDEVKPPWFFHFLVVNDSSWGFHTNIILDVNDFIF